MNLLSAELAQTLLKVITASHYENKPIQIYWKVSHQKNKKFQTKN